MLDRYIIGKVNRISPEAPVPVVHVAKEEFRLGGCGNVANSLIKLGIPTHLFAAVGKDYHGLILQNLISQNGIQSFVFENDAPTICKTRVIGNSQQIVRFDYEDPTSSHEHNKLLYQLLDSQQYQYIVISDYKKGVCNTSLCKTIISLCASKSTRVIVDPKGSSWEKYSGAYMVTPNLKELSEIFGKDIPNENQTITEFGNVVRQRYQFENLLVTRSEKGMTLITEEETSHFPTTAKDVFDVSGAGDTVIATFAASLANGLNLKDAVVRANIAAGIAVSHFGTYAVGKEELERVYETLQNPKDLLQEII